MLAEFAPVLAVAGQTNPPGHDQQDGISALAGGEQLRPLAKRAARAGVGQQRDLVCR